MSSIKCTEKQLFRIAEAFNIEPSWHCDTCWGEHPITLLKTKSVWLFFYTETGVLRTIRLWDTEKFKHYLNSAQINFDDMTVNHINSNLKLAEPLASALARLGCLDGVALLENECGPILTAHQRLEASFFGREVADGT